jgi:hypothetical protein
MVIDVPVSRGSAIAIFSVVGRGSCSCSCALAASSSPRSPSDRYSRSENGSACCACVCDRGYDSDFGCCYYCYSGCCCGSSDSRDLLLNRRELVVAGAEATQLGAPCASF